LEIAELLIKRGADVNVADSNGQTPLHALAGRGAQRRHMGARGVEVARMLLEHGADVRAKDHSGRTAWDLADSSFYTGMVDLLSAAAETTTSPPAATPTGKSKGDGKERNRTGPIELR
jgi:ankyrin repeat protein